MLYEHEEYIFQYLDTYKATKDGRHMSSKGHKNYYCERSKKIKLVKYHKWLLGRQYMREDIQNRRRSVLTHM